MDEFTKEFKEFVKDIEWRCGMARDSQFNAAGYWDKVNRWLGLLAVISGAVGGGAAAGTATLDTSWSIPLAAVLSTTAGLLAAANSFLKPSERVEAHKRAGDGWSILKDKAKKLGQLDTYGSQAPEPMRAALDKILEEKQRVTASSPVIPTWIYNQTSRQHDRMARGLKHGTTRA